MKAIVFIERNRVELTDLPDPAAGPNEVVVEVKASGICHTDYEVLKDNYGSGAFPVVPGHEYAGIVADVGSDVKNLKVGDRVVVDPNLECGECWASKRSWAHLCENLGAYGVTTHGGFSEFSLVRADRVHSAGDVAFDRVALAEPMGCILNGVNAVHAEWMETTLIFGAGPMGLLMAFALKTAGVSEINFCDIDATRVELAKASGFRAFLSAPDSLSKLEQSFDLVVDTTGVAQVAGQLTSYMRNGGKGLFFGVCPQDAQISISPFEIFRRQLTLAGSHSLNHNIPQALDVIAHLGSALDPVVSHRLGLAEISDILSSKPPAGSLKVQWIA